MIHKFIRVLFRGIGIVQDFYRRLSIVVLILLPLAILVKLYLNLKKLKFEII